MRSSSDAIPKSMECPTLNSNSCVYFTAEELQHIPLDQVQYRLAHPEDKQDLINLHDEWFPIDYGSRYYDEITMGNPSFLCLVAYASESTLSEYLPHKPTLTCCILGVIVISFFGKNIPHEHLTMMSKYVSDIDDIGYVCTLGISEHYRRRGLGKAILNEAIHELKQTYPCITLLSLHVATYNNTAIEFYKRLSFKSIKVIYNFYFIEGYRYDSQLMIRHISDSNSASSFLSATQNSHSSNFFYSAIYGIYNFLKKIFTIDYHSSYSPSHSKPICA